MNWNINFASDKKNPTDYDIHIFYDIVLPLLYFFILLVVFINLENTSWLFALVVSLGYLILYVIYPLAREIFGKRKHQSIHETELFLNLKKEGFQVETFGEYKGLIKTISGRTVRIMYGWEKSIRGLFSFGDIVIEIMHQPLSLQFEERKKEDQRKLDILDKKYRIKKLWYKRFLGWHHLVLCINSYPWTKAETVLQKIEDTLQVIDDNELQPMQLGEIDPSFRVFEERGDFLPYMDFVHKQLERQNGQISPK